MNTKRTKKLSRRLVSILVTVAMVMGMLPVTNVQEAMATSTGTTVTLTIGKPENGTFTATGDNFINANTMSAEVDKSETLCDYEIKAIPDSGYQFAGWMWHYSEPERYEDSLWTVAQGATQTLTWNGSIQDHLLVIKQYYDTITPVFEARPTIAYIDKAATGGTVTVSDVTTECVVETTSQYKIVGGDLVPTGTVTAVPADGYQFVRWDLKDKSTGQVTREFAHDARLEINGGIAMMLGSESGENANLVPVFKPTHITITADTGGTVSATGPQISENNMTWTSLSDIQTGANTITATPKLGYKFKYWTMKSSADSSGTTYISYEGQATNPIDGKDAATNLWNCDTLVAVFEPDPNYATVTMRETNQLVEIAGTYSETQFAFKGDVLLTYPLASGITNETLIITNNNEGEHIEKIIVYKQGTDEVVAEYDAAATYNATTDTYGHSYNLFGSDTDLDAKVKAQSKITGLEIEIITTHDNVYYDRTLNIFAEPGGDYTATGTGVDHGIFTSYYNKALYMTRGTAFSDYKNTIITAVPNEGYTFKHWILRTLVNFDLGPIDDVVLGTIAKLDVEQVAKYIDKNCSYDDYNLNRGNSEYYIVAVFEPTQTTDTYSVWPKDAGKLVGTRYIPNDGYEFKYISLIRKAGTETDCTCGCDDSCPCKREFYSVQSYFHCDLPIVKGAFCCDKCFGNFDVTAFFVPTTNTTNFATLSFTSDYGIVSHDSYVMPIDATATAVPVISQGYDGTSFANWTTVVDGKETIISEKFTLDAETIKKYAYKDGQWVDTTFTANYYYASDQINGLGNYDTDVYTTIQNIDPVWLKNYAFYGTGYIDETSIESGVPDDKFQVLAVYDQDGNAAGSTWDSTAGVYVYNLQKYSWGDSTYYTYPVGIQRLGEDAIVAPVSIEATTSVDDRTSIVSLDNFTLGTGAGWKAVELVIYDDRGNVITEDEMKAQAAEEAVLFTTDSTGKHMGLTQAGIVAAKKVGALRSTATYDTTDVIHCVLVVEDMFITKLRVTTTMDGGTATVTGDGKKIGDDKVSIIEWPNACYYNETLSELGDYTATPALTITATAKDGYEFKGWGIKIQGKLESSGEIEVPEYWDTATLVYNDAETYMPDEKCQSVFLYASTLSNENIPLHDGECAWGGTKHDALTGFIRTYYSLAYNGHCYCGYNMRDVALELHPDTFVDEGETETLYCYLEPIFAETDPEATYTIQRAEGDEKLTYGQLSATSEKVTASMSGSAATATTGSKFINWLDSTGNTLTTAANINSSGTTFTNLLKDNYGYYKSGSFKAVFVQEQVDLTFKSSDETMGTIKVEGGADVASDTQSVQVISGTTASGDSIKTVTATKKNGYQFDGWSVGSGSVFSTDTTLSLTDIATHAKSDDTYKATTFVANFSKLKDAILTFNTDSHGTVSSSSQTATDSFTQPVNPETGQAIDVTAAASKGYKFKNWTIGSEVVSESETLSAANVIDIKAKSNGKYVDTTFTANFTEDVENKVTLTFAVNDKNAASLRYDTDETTVQLETISQAVEPISGTPKTVVSAGVSGYAFTNWTIQQEGAEAVTHSTATISATDIMKYAMKDGVYVPTTFTANYESTDITAAWVKQNAGLGVYTNGNAYGVPQGTQEATSTGGTITYTTEGVKVTPAAGYYAEVHISYVQNTGGTSVPSLVPQVAYTRDASGSLTITNEELVNWAKQFYRSTNDPIYNGVKYPTLNAWFATDSDVQLTYQSSDPNEGTVTNTADTVKAYSGTITGAQAEPKAGYEVEKWTANGSEAAVSKDATLTDTAIKQYMSEKYAGKNTATTFTAHFAEKDEIIITYKSADETMGYVGGTAGDKTEKVLPATGTPVGQTATAKTGYHFTGWQVTVGETITDIPTKDTPNGALTKAIIDTYAKKTYENGAVYEAATFVASFAPDAVTLRATVNDSTMGSVSPDTQNITSNATTTGTFVASPKTGHHFEQWQTADGTKIEGVTVAEDGKATLSAELIALYAKSGGLYQNNYTFKAVFAEDEATLTFESSDPDMGSVSPSAPQTIKVVTGSAQAVTATANPGYKFVGWVDKDGNAITTDATHATEAGDTITVTEIDAKAKSGGIYVDTTFVAKFEEKASLTYTYTVDTNKGEIVDGQATETGISPVPSKGGPKGVTVQAKTGYTFTGWSLDTETTVESKLISKATKLDATAMVEHIKNTDGSYKAATFVANFKENADAKLEFVVSGSGTITIEGKVAATNDVQSVPPVTGSAKAVTLQPASGQQFTGWEVTVGGDTRAIPTDETPDGTLTTTIIDKYAKADGIYVNTKFKANFAELGSVTITYVVEGGGDVGDAHMGAGHVSSTHDTVNPETGNPTGSEATAHAGYTFLRWEAYRNGVKVGETTNNPLEGGDLDTLAKVSGKYVTTEIKAIFKENDPVNVVFNVLDSNNTTDGGSITLEGSTTEESTITQPLKPATDSAKEVTAAEKPGYTFAGWFVTGATEAFTTNHKLTLDDINSKARTQTVGTTSAYVATTFTAKFTEDEATITYEVNDANMGSVIITNPTTTSPLTQKLKAKTGVAVDATASAKPGYEFVRWEIGGEPIQEKTADDDNAELLAKALITEKSTDSDGVYQNTTITAVFKQKADAIITYRVNAPGTGTVKAPSDEEATATTSEEVAVVGATAVGEVVATARPGYHFVKWTLENRTDALTSGESAYTLPQSVVVAKSRNAQEVYQNTTFVAHFEANPDVTITYKVDTASKNMGTVKTTKDAKGLETTSEIVAPLGHPIGVTAEPATGYMLKEWTVNTDANWKSTKLTLDESDLEAVAKKSGEYVATVFTAHFEEKQEVVELKFETTTGGSIAGTTTQTPTPVTGTVTEVVASADRGYKFIGWTIDTDPSINYKANDGTGTLSVAKIEELAKTDGVFVKTTFTAHFELLDDVAITFTTADDKTGKIVGLSSTDTYIQSINPQLEEPDPVSVEPASGYEFEKWVLVKDAVETAIPAEETVDGTLTKTIIDKYAKVGDDYVKTTFKAYFKEQTHVTLSYEASTGGSVVATTNPESINPQTGSPKGATASPEAGYSFSRWEAYRAGVKVGEATNNPLASGDFDTLAKVDGKYVTTTFKAIFDENENSLLTFSAGVAGEVSAVGYTTDESITQPVAPATGVPVDVTFTASAGYVFEGWKVTVGGMTTEYTKDELPETLTSAKILELTRDTLIRPATFVVMYSELPSVTLDFSIDEASAAMGHISPSTQTIDPKDVQIQPIQATANAGYHFVEWQDESGATITTENPLSVAMINSLARNEDGSYKAIKLKPIFGEDRDVIIYYSSEGRGRVSLDQESVPPATGDPQGATATADTGYMLDGWYDESGMKVSSQAEFVPTRTGGVYVGTTYTARFVVDPAYAPVLEVTNEPDVSYAQVGDEITYTITVSNTGYIDAEDTSIVYTLEDGYEYVSHEPSTGTLSGQTITWSGANIPADGSVEYKVTVKVKETASGNLGGGSISVSDSASGSSTTVESEDSGSSIPVISLPTDVASYTAFWQRVTAATESSERDGVYGFIRGNLVEYEVTITNDSTMALTMDVEDTLADDGIFSDREIKSVTGATRNYDLESGVNITIAVGKTATVRFAVNVEANVDEYDDKQFGDAGHVNEVVISSVVATAELADGTTISYSKDGSVAGTNAWTGSGDPLADTTVSGTIPTRQIDETVTYSLDINWADTVPTYRPASIKVALVRTDTGETVEEKTLTAEDRTSSDVWSTTFSPWPVYDTVDISPLSEVSMLEALLARSHAVSAAAVDSSTVESDVVDSSTSDSEVADIDVVDSDVADIIEDDTVADDTSADTLDSESTSDIVATDSEASIDSSDALDEAIETSDTDASATEEAGTTDSIADETTESTEESDSPLLDGTVLDDTEVYDSRLHDVVAARRYVLASLVSGLEDGEDRGEPIEYTVVVLSDVPDGYTMSEVTSTGEKFEVTLSRPWTPRQISSSGTSSSNGSSSSSSSSSGSSGSGSGSGSSSGSGTSATGEIGPGIGLSSIGSTSSGSGSSTGTSTAQVGPGVGLGSSGSGSGSTGTSSGSGSSNISTSWGSSLAAKAIANALQSATGTAGTSGTGTTTGTTGAGIAGSTGTTTGSGTTGDASTGTTGTAGTTGATTGLVESDILAGIGPARTSTYVFIAGEDGLWQAHTTGTTVTAGTVDISSLAGLGDVEFALADSSVLTNQWALIGTVAEEDSTITYEWYHFGDTGSIDTGWFTDEAGHWYYLSENSDGSLGSMSVGWQYSSEDGRWYYLDATTGTMLTGWQKIDGAWYYFTTGTPIETWEYNVLTRKWVYKNIEDARPLGSLYIDETTPDGYVVGKSGAVEE